MSTPRSYDDWVERIPECIKQDALWNLKAYRQALFLAELARWDSEKMKRDEIDRAVSDQLYRAVGSIGANIAEGYGRFGRRDRARFYEYALGSARESRHWYIQGRYALGEDVMNHRLDKLTTITRLLIRYVTSIRPEHGLFDGKRRAKGQDGGPEPQG